jgi:hypothetical protein
VTGWLLGNILSSYGAPEPSQVVHYFGAATQSTACEHRGGHGDPFGIELLTNAIGGQNWMIG